MAITQFPTKQPLTALRDMGVNAQAGRVAQRLPD